MVVLSARVEIGDHHVIESGHGRGHAAPKGGGLEGGHARRLPPYASGLPSLLPSGVKVTGAAERRGDSLFPHRPLGAALS